MHGKRRQNEWHEIEYQGAKAKAPPCSDRTLQTPLPQQSSSSAREEEARWVLVEEKRKRGIAFDKLAKEMLRHLDNCNEVKVGITELHERLEVLVQICISIQQVAQQARSENGQKIQKKNHVSPAGPHGIMMRKWGPCMKCMVRWRQNMRSSGPSRGRS